MHLTAQTSSNALLDPLKGIPAVTMSCLHSVRTPESDPELRLQIFSR